MGIECDGAAYHSAKSARDRLRQEVLERLGWRISRIWSTDWFSNPDEVLSPIIRQLHELKTLAPDVVVPSYEYVETIESSAAVASGSIDSLMPNLGLKEKLKYFATYAIEVKFPNVDAERRLLRPAMLEVLLEHQPLSRSEFVERIPYYLRQATDVNEAQRFLDQVLALINGAEAEANDAVFGSELALLVKGNKNNGGSLVVRQRALRIVLESRMTRSGRQFVPLPQRLAVRWNPCMSGYTSMSGIPGAVMVGSLPLNGIV